MQQMCRFLFIFFGRIMRRRASWIYWPSLSIVVLALGAIGTLFAIKYADEKRSNRVANRTDIGSFLVNNAEWKMNNPSCTQ